MPIRLPVFTERFLPWILLAMYHCIIKQDSPSLPSTDLKPKHQCWLPEVSRLCNIINPHLISSPKKVLSLSTPVLLASLSHGCHIRLASSGKLAESFLCGSAGLMPSQYSSHFSKEETGMWLSKIGLSFPFSDTQKVLPQSYLWGLLGCMLLHKW